MLCKLENVLNLFQASIRVTPASNLAGTLVIPDILANAGGVIVSYFEWVQDLQNFFWSEDEINTKLKEMLSRTFHQVLTLSQKEGVSLRVAALMIAVQRVARAMLLRGLYA